MRSDVKGLRHLLFVRHRHNWHLLTRFSVVGATGVLVNLLVFGLALQSGIDPHRIVSPRSARVITRGTSFSGIWRGP